MSDMLSTSSDYAYGSLWKKKQLFGNVRNPTQTALCMKFKAKFLKYIFGDLKHEFSGVDMTHISYNAAAIKGAFTFNDAITLGHIYW